ncbi:MAG: ABC transporter substrate-binding protein [Comamonas sp.]|nr:ABC transporter substrate-binding protein [Comamonas sp.]
MPTVMNRPIFALAAAALLSAGAAQAQMTSATTTTTAQNSTHAHSTAPQRVVAYDLGALEILQALGIPAAGGPQAQFPAYLADYTARYTVAGSLFEPDYDALSKIRPDLIIVGGRSAAKAQTLGKLAPVLDFSVRGDHLLHDLERNITDIARLYGKQAQGKALVDKINQEVAELRRLSSQAAPGVLLMAINEKIMPQAPGSRFGLLFDVLGAKSALTAQDVPARGGPAYTFDDLVKLQPQWIYVIDRNTAVGSAAGGGEIIPSPKVFDNAQVRATPAGQKGQVVFLDPKGWYLMGSSGPTALLNNVAQLQQAYRAAGIK